MIPVLTRRVRITTVTIVVLVIVVLLSAPASVLSIVLGDDDHPLLPVPPAIHLASAETTSPGKQHVQKMRNAPPRRLVSEHKPFDDGTGQGIDHLEHQAEELMGAMLSDVELTQIPISLDGDGLLDGFDGLQAGHLPLYTFSNGGFGFPRGGMPFLPGVGLRGGSIRRRLDWQLRVN
jgi:hypothetical protein